MKAKYIGRFKHKYDDGIDLLYKYRGYQYMICDTHNGCMEMGSLAKQHREEQDRIDKIIEHKENQPEVNQPFNVDEIYKMLGWE